MFECENKLKPYLLEVWVKNESKTMIQRFKEYLYLEEELTFFELRFINKERKEFVYRQMHQLYDKQYSSISIHRFEMELYFKYMEFLKLHYTIEQFNNLLNQARKLMKEANDE